ncbi:MAG TPA: exodeoxyribonuclease VII small subunit [Streptosporangiaceae bacterium]
MATSKTEQTDTPAEAQTDAQTDALSYEQARDQLASVVKRLETGGLALEQSLELWERGERLAAVCGRLLEGARARLSAATAERSGDADDDADRPF